MAPAATATPLAARWTATGTATATATADAFGQQLTDGTESYAYDALGRMTTITPSSGTATTLSYTGSSGLIASDGTSTYTWTPGGSLVGIGVAGGPASSGVLAMTDQHTDVVADFTPTGTALSGSTAYNPLGNVITTSGTPAGHLGYQSAFTDPVTGKVQMGSRWYNPAAGTFTSRDTAANSPVPDSAAANPFAYAGDDPMLSIDPTGHSFWSSAWHARTSFVSSAWHATTSFVSSAWHATTSFVSNAWHATTSFVSSAWDTATSWVSDAWQAASSALDNEIDQELAALDREIRVLTQQIHDELARARAEASRVIHRVVRTVRKVYHVAASYIRTAYHEVKQVAKSGAAWVKQHKAAIASFAAGAAVFVGCEALTGGAGSVGCAAAAGAVGNLVSYDMSCGSAGGCSVAGALVSAGVGAIAGAVGGSLAGALGGRLASSALGNLLPSFVTQGLVGAASGAAAGATAGAAGYGAQCAQGGNCSLSGLGSAAASGAESGAIGGAAFGALGGGLKDLNGNAAEDSTDLAGVTCGGQSFAAGTKVLTGSGSLVAISKLRVGQKVLATDTKTGKTAAETIAAVLVHQDTDRYDLRVRAAHGTAVFDTTRSHLFWDSDSHRWVKAAALKYGTHLRTPSGGSATALGGWTPRDTSGWMWDLTIPGNHDFYVEGTLSTASAVLSSVGSSPQLAVLVHNCPAEGGGAKEPGEWPNLEPENLGLDEQDALFAGVTPAAPGTGAFDRAIASGVIKWAVTKSLGLRIMPSEVAGFDDLYHSVLSGGEPVLAAGTARIDIWEEGYYGRYINNHTGHFQNEEESLQIGVSHFSDIGIEFRHVGSYDE